MKLTRLNLNRFVFLLILFGISLAVGCGGGKPKRVPISGQVLFDGKPLKYGYIRFIPPNDRASGGKLSPDGKFTLSCFVQNDGAVVATHQVTVEAGEEISETKVKWHAPKLYKDSATSGLTQVVTEANDNTVINIKSDGKTYPYTETVR